MQVQGLQGQQTRGCSGCESKSCWGNSCKTAEAAARPCSSWRSSWATRSAEALARDQHSQVQQLREQWLQALEAAVACAKAAGQYNAQVQQLQKQELLGQQLHGQNALVQQLREQELQMLESSSCKRKRCGGSSTCRCSRRGSMAAEASSAPGELVQQLQEQGLLGQRLQVQHHKCSSCESKRCKCSGATVASAELQGQRTRGCGSCRAAAEPQRLATQGLLGQ